MFRQILGLAAALAPPIPSGLLRRSACSCLDVGKRANLLHSPEPATVSKYDVHILLRLPQATGVTFNGCRWPAVVEKEAAFVQVFATLAAFLGKAEDHDIKFKLTAFEPVEGGPKLKRDECGVILFPHGAEYLRLKVSQLVDVLRLHLTDVSPRELPKIRTSLPNPLDCNNMMHFLVCAHGSRDSRCGKIGTKVAAKLHDIALRKNLRTSARVLECSHIGGHKYAGNVVVYFPRSPNNGDWFGGINEQNCGKLLDQLTTKEIGENGLESDFLRKCWRGKMGLTIDEQLQHIHGSGLPTLPEIPDEEPPATSNIAEVFPRSRNATTNDLTQEERVGSGDAVGSMDGLHVDVDANVDDRDHQHDVDFDGSNQLLEGGSGEEDGKNEYEGDFDGSNPLLEGGSGEEEDSDVEFEEFEEDVDDIADAGGGGRVVEVKSV
ncbi:hypothetical protein BSKO_05967 [Bryopsis sp. KO-2023]|nr:hypothetical protein BSKO_05967 [Bryopsis sp. KO-2023]